MISEFHRLLETNQDIQPLHMALQQIPNLPEIIQTDNNITIEQIDLIQSIIQLQQQIRLDKLSIHKIQQFKQLILQITNQDCNLYRSCDNYYNDQIRNLDYHSTVQVNNLELHVDLKTYQWIQDNISTLPELSTKLQFKFKDLITLSFSHQKNLIIPNNSDILYQSSTIIVYILDNQLTIDVKFLITKQSEMIELLYGYLTYLDYLKVDLHQYLIESIASIARQTAIKQPILIDNIPIHNKFQQFAISCCQIADLQTISEKHHQFSQVDKIKEHLIYFKEKYLGEIEKLEFKQPNNSSWKKMNFLFKTQNEPSQKTQSALFLSLSNDLATLKKWINEKNQQLNELIVAHFRLLDILLLNKHIVHNFQSLNFYISVYSQIEYHLKLIPDTIEYLIQIKLAIREYKYQLNQIVQDSQK